MNKRNCEYCGNSIPESRIRIPSVRFCSRKCANASWREEHKDQSFAGLSAINMGALSELVACGDLLRRGYEVFRSVSPHASCDLIIQKGGIVKRVEVRTGYRNQDGSIRCSFTDKDVGRSDVLCIVLYGREVVYKPSLEE